MVGLRRARKARNNPVLSRPHLPPNSALRNIEELTWHAWHQEHGHDYANNPYTAFIEIKSIDTWAFEVEVYLAFTSEVDSAADPLGESFEENAERIKEAAFQVIKDGAMSFNSQHEPDVGEGHGRGAIDDLIGYLDDVLRLNNHSSSVARIDGVWVSWGEHDDIEAITCGELGREIVLTSARTAFVSQWAYAMEEAGRGAELSQQELMNIAPAMSNESIAWAQELWARVVKANNGKVQKEGPDKGKKIEVFDAGSCWFEVIDATGVSGNRARHDFAHYTAMQAMGHGVSWNDSYDKHGLKIPHFEANFYVEVERLPPRITITYEIITPESAENGEAEEQGWENEEGVEMDADYEGNGPEHFIPYVDDAVRFLRAEGVDEPSSTPTFHEGVWYTAHGDQDIQDGSYTNHSYHLEDFTEDEEREIYNRLFPKKKPATNPRPARKARRASTRS